MIKEFEHSSGDLKIGHLFKQWKAGELKPKEHPNMLLGRLSSIERQLSSLGDPISDINITMRFISAIEYSTGHPYGDVLSQYEGLVIYGKEIFTLEQLVEFLSRKYRKNEKIEPTPTHTMKGSASQGKCRTCGKIGHGKANCWLKHPERRPTRSPQPVIKRNKERKCWNCGMTGHISKNCQARKPNEQIRTVASAIPTSDEVVDIKLNPTYVDSACSCHIVASISMHLYISQSERDRWL